MDDASDVSMIGSNMNNSSIGGGAPGTDPSMGGDIPSANPLTDDGASEETSGPDFVDQGKFAQKGTELDNLPVSSTDSKAAEKYLEYIADKTREEMNDNNSPNDANEVGNMAMQENYYVLTKKQITEMYEAGQPLCGELENTNEPKYTTKKQGAIKKKAFDAPKFGLSESDYNVKNNKY